MRSMNTQLEQLQLLVDRIQHQEGGERANKGTYDKLLTLSEQLDYAYGQALAHISLAHAFWVTREDEFYYFHLEKARRIAENKNFFDVLMSYYQLEGLRNAAECNETTALAQYLSGAKIAMEIKDTMAAAGFHRDIGDLFYSNGAYEDAERFYLESLELLEGLTVADARFRRKVLLVGLTHLACIRGDVSQARVYQDQSQRIDSGGRHLWFMQREGEAFIQVLEGQRDQARQSVSGLVDLLGQGGYPDLPEVAYFVLMGLLLELKDQRGAAWCMGRIDELCKNPSQSLLLRTQKIRLQYAETFDLNNDEQYRLFYEGTVDSGLLRTRATGESFKNLIALYETKKARDRDQIEQSELETAVNSDELTKIYNRRYLGKLVSKLTQDARVSSLGYVMIDVDYFKEYNDQYGHPQGDTALVAVAALLAEQLPEDGYAVRYGGDEFVCLLVDRSEAELVSFVEKTQRALAQQSIPHKGGGKSGILTMTFGIYNETHPLGSDEATLASRADDALYRAKERGRGTYAIYKQREDM